MKKILFLLVVSFSFGLTAFSQTTDEIIDKHLKAMGGADKLMSLKSIVMEGSVNSQGMEIPVKITKVNNKGTRVEFSVMGMDAWTVMRPDSGWSFMPFNGQTKPEPMPAEALKERADDNDLSGQLCNYKEKGNMVEYLGMDDVDGTECFKLKCVNKTGATTYYLLDPQTYYMVKMIAKTNAGGQEMEVESSFSNYKEVEGGYIFPYSIESMGGPLEISKIAINVDVPNEKLLIFH